MGKRMRKNRKSKNQKDGLYFDVTGKGKYFHPLGNVRCIEGACDGLPMICPWCNGVAHAEYYGLFNLFIKIKCERCKKVIPT